MQKKDHNWQNRSLSFTVYFIRRMRNHFSLQQDSGHVSDVAFLGRLQVSKLRAMQRNHLIPRVGSVVASFGDSFLSFMFSGSLSC